MKRILTILSVFSVLAACTPSGYRDASPAQDALNIYPDYTDVVIPFNIAPMNFNLKNAADASVVEVAWADGSMALKGPEVSFPLKKWRSMLEAAKGGDLTFTVYAKSGGKWFKYNSFKMTVASDAIDPYVTYRLIEPGYSYYSQLILCQRDLTSFKEKDLYNNSLISGRVEQQCINCHSFQNFNAEKFQFHARQTAGGTALVSGDKGKRIAFQTGDLISNAVYPSWHPTEDLIAYSVNSTAQIFHTVDRQKVEVFDSRSDLILYDVNKDEVSYIVHDSLAFETFPYWAADGKTLYYASSYIPAFGADTSTDIPTVTEDIRYSIMAVDFDPQTKAFGEPRMIFDAQGQGLSAVTPRPSPDGKYLLSGVSDFGSFHIWHEKGDIYLTDLATGETRPLDEINSPKADSFKAWSSNSRWIVFTTRRDDGSYTRLYFAYFDSEGRAHKPFILPQEDPEQNLRLFKSYNVPEFTKNLATWDAKRIEELLFTDPVQVTQVDPVTLN